MKFRIDKGTGYKYCYNPTHYLANKAGKVIEHVYVMSKAIGRPLEEDECVHHKNRDRADNRLENLKLMTVAEHALLHKIEDSGYATKEIKCLFCSKIFVVSSKSTRSYCSSYCSSDSTLRFDVNREDLYILVWSKPTVEVAKLLGVSDVAVSKRCKKLEVPKPPRGYWAKVAAGLTPEIAPLPK